jgi:hypothetical protein
MVMASLEDALPVVQQQRSSEPQQLSVKVSITSVETILGDEEGRDDRTTPRTDGRIIIARKEKKLLQKGGDRSHSHRICR